MLLLHKDFENNYSMYTALLQIISLQFCWVFFRVRAKALQYFAQCATSENSLLVTRVKEILCDPQQRPAEGTPTVNRQSNGESLMDYVK